MKLIDGVPKEILDALDRENKICSSNTVNRFEEEWLKNIRENTKNPIRSAKELKGTKSGRVYIVGAGPSLKKNIADLKGKHPIICASHAYKPLKDNGIDPEFVINVDSNTKASEFLGGGDSTLISSLVADPRSVKGWRGDVLFVKCVTESGLDEKVAEITDFDDKLTSGGNVIGAATVLAVAWGFTELVFVGVDLAYDSADKYYAFQSQHDEDCDNFLVYSVNGDYIRTNFVFYHYKIWLDLWSTQMDNIKFINATEGGTLGVYEEGFLKTIKQIPLKEVL